METKMRKIALTILGALLIAGSTVQTATAERHHVRKARVAPTVASQQFRNANGALFNDSVFNQRRVITDCQYRESGNPYDERTDYEGWSAWREDGGWDGRNDCW
jgi:hypothetical protein